MRETQPLRKKVRASHNDDIESERLGRYTYERVCHSHGVVRSMKDLRKFRHQLLVKRRPHHQSDHQEIDEQHCRLTDAVSSVPLLFREKHASDQSCSHDELHDEVEICREWGASAQKSLYRKKRVTMGFHSYGRSIMLVARKLFCPNVVFIHSGIDEHSARRCNHSRRPGNVKDRTAQVAYVFGKHLRSNMANFTLPSP